MPGAHSRPTERERPADAATPPRRARPPQPETVRPDTGEIDRNYGDVPRGRREIGPAPLSPPVGFPAAGAPHTPGAPDPAPAPRRDATPGSDPSRQGPAPTGAVVPPPPPPRSSGAAPRPAPRPAPGAPATPGPGAPPRGGPPARPAPGPATTGATTGTAGPPPGPAGPGAPAAPGRGPVALAGPGAPARVPDPGGSPSNSGPSPVRSATALAPRPAPAPRPGPPFPGAPARPGPPAGPPAGGPAAPGRPATPPPAVPGPPAPGPRRDAPATPGTPDGADAAAGRSGEERPDATLVEKVDRAALVATTSASPATSTSSSTPGAEGLSGATKQAGATPRTTTTRTTRAAGTPKTGTAPSTTRSRSASPRRADKAPTRGRVAAGIAGVLAVVAATVGRWPGGERVVAAGRWVVARVRRYLDGPRPEKLSVTALRWRRGRRTAYAGLGAMVGVPVLMLAFGWLFIPVPNADEAVESQLNTVAFADGSVLARISPGEQGNRQKVDIARVPLGVQRAVLSAEDRTYYENSGFDVQGIARAVWKNLTGGTGGGSTITQQYVKNAMVGDEYSLMRKYKELIISSKITQERSKDEILGDYLNSIYFGRGAYGIQAASQAYFGRPVETLTPADGALLAGIIQSPSRWDPAVKYDDAVRRWNYVMDGMVSQGWLPAAERAVARFPATVPPRKAANGVPDDDRGHIYSAVKEELARLGIDEDALVTEGLQIETSIEPQAQRNAAEAARRELAGQPANLRTSIVSIDPRDGSVVAYYGGDNGSGLDYAEVVKQPGSTFKPFVLLAALQKDPPIGLSTEFDGRAIQGQTVRNSEGADCTNCNLKRAMTLSNNVVFMSLGNKVGPQAIAAAARQAGVTQKMDDPTSGIALGNAETTPFDMASAYATFANDGLYFRPHLVQKVTTANGDVLYDHSAGEGEQRIAPDVARNVTEAMRDVPEHDGASLAGGRASAAKTGTVQSHVEAQNNDAWFVGYTPGLSTAIWVGTDDNTPIRTTSGSPIFGHGLPSELWKRYMDEALEGEPERSFGEFTPIGGSDPGDTADGEAPEQRVSTSSPPTTSTSAPPTSTSVAPSRAPESPRPTPSSTPAAPPAAPPAPASPAPASDSAGAARVPVDSGADLDSDDG